MGALGLTGINGAAGCPRTTRPPEASQTWPTAVQQMSLLLSVAPAVTFQGIWTMGTLCLWTWGPGTTELLTDDWGAGSGSGRVRTIEMHDRQPDLISIGPIFQGLSSVPVPALAIINCRYDTFANEIDLVKLSI